MLTTYLSVTYTNLINDSVVVRADYFYSAIATAAVGGIIIGIPCVVLIGLPTYYLFKKYRFANPLAYGLVGFIGGIFALSLLLFGKAGASSQILSLGGLYFGLLGLTVSVIFWFIAVYLHNRSMISSSK